MEMERDIHVLLATQQQLAKSQTQILHLMEIPQEGHQVKLKLYKEGEDVEAFLCTFEQMMVLHNVPKDQWVQQLVPSLAVKTQETYADMEAGATYPRPRQPY